MDGSIGAVEREASLREVRRFVDRAVEPRVERPETPMSLAALGALLDEAEGLGFAGSADEPTGLGAWETLVDEGLPGHTLETLVCLADGNAGVAFAVHQRALARAACRLAGRFVEVAEPLAIAPLGHYGLGRLSIVRWLAGEALDADDDALLDDLYAASAPRVVTVEPGFAGGIFPVRVGTSVQWLVADRAHLDFDAQPHPHGFDELSTGAAVLPERVDASSLAEAAARAVFAALTGAHQLALVAIARGAVERGLRLARRYAAERYQGGAMIDRHPAVLELLGRSRSELVVVDALLQRAARTRLDAAGWVAALAVRARAAPALADAANAALQVFGGVGYMRDVGVEKVVRDVNHLRAIGGPLGEAGLIVAEWERVHA
ncbi:MAG: acyl-CoA/acyl-ACP dehydrogenase [Myxococcales bacterium]|nr:acyl-CoA/acyl-ACP dehydrogenase [Myxococcales bacterium]